MIDTEKVVEQMQESEKTAQQVQDSEEVVLKVVLKVDPKVVEKRIKSWIPGLGSDGRLRRLRRGTNPGHVTHPYVRSAAQPRASERASERVRTTENERAKEMKNM